jgi:hypothetical protein
MMPNRITKASDWHRDYAGLSPLYQIPDFMTLEPSMICTLVLENGRRDSLLYLRVTTVFKLLRLVELAVETGPWTHIGISKI